MLLSIVLTLLLLFICWPIFSIKGMIMIHFLFINLFLEIIYYIGRKYCINKKISLVFKSGLISLIISCLIVSYGYMNMNTIHKQEYKIYSHKVDSLKIGALSDLHFGINMNLDDLEKYCHDIDEENIDLLVIVGDLVDEGTTKENMIQTCKVLGNVKSTYGTYYVFGNHDPNLYSSTPSYTKEDLLYHLSQNNIKVLEDETVSINNISIVGRKDRSQKRLSVEELVKDVDNDNYILMLDHQPYEFDDKVGYVDLSISGHSHAGQVWPLGTIMELLSINDLNYGYKQIKNSHFITTSGMAGWGFPIRTEKQCEYLIIEVSK